MLDSSMLDARLLDVQRLTTTFATRDGCVRAVDEVSFWLRPGETLGLVGESGSGKTITALSIARLVQPPGSIAGGRVLFEGRDLLQLSEREMREVRGARISLVLQEPSTALNPVFTIGDHLAEAMRVHGVSRRDARDRALDLLAAVKLPDPAEHLRRYPHELSGGMRQRVVIALALACRPSLVIADEPTTALDATIQALVLDLLRDMRSAFGVSLLLITHDLGIVAGMADRVAVLYAGRVVEQGAVRDLFRAPAHPYTRALMASLPERAVGRRLTAIEGGVPSMHSRPRGCAFAPRCKERLPVCDMAAPPLTMSGAREVRCHLHPSC